MSRRKQGRPQQRKTLDSLEQENDLLVCGDCQTSFPLHDIVHFIKHKKQCCDKENLDSNGCRKDLGGNDRDDKGGDNPTDSDDEALPSSRKTKNDENEVDGEDDDEVDDEDPTLNGDKDDEQMTSEEREKKRRKEDVGISRSKEERKPLKQKQVVDAESNTTHSEPSRFECETCRSTYTSAWGLLQHAQKEHGMKIYTSPSSSSSSAHSNVSTTPVLNNASPIDLAMTSSSRSGVDRRSASSTGSGGSVSPFPVHAPNPFSSPFRLPLDGRLPHPSSLSPFSRGPTLDLDLINDTRLRPQFFGRGIPGLDPSTFPPSPFDRSRGPIPHGLESQYDYYSMRLKQLACSPVLPHGKSFLNPTPAQTAAPSLTPTPTKAQTPPAEPTSSSSPRSSNLSTVLALPQKLKSCEFCGKSFRFQSNLVVHRRSHTGEKPFKCPKCPHACTQQSKLKRHMKTHSTKNQNAEGSTSPGGTPIDVKEEDIEDGDEEEEEEEEELEEMEGEEEEEEIVEEEMNEEEREVLESMRAAKRDERQPDAEPGEIRQEAKRIKREHSSDRLPEDNSEPSDLSMKKPKQAESLLSEVMKNSGLNSIQTYNEAFQAALAESQENEKNRELDKPVVKSEGKNGETTPRPSTPKSPKEEKESDKDGEKGDENEHSFFGGTELMSKSGKNNTSPASVWNAAVESLANPIESAASMYSRLQHPWFHPDNPVRLFFQPGYAPRLPPARDLSLSRENHGLNLSPTTTTSALSSTSPNLPAIFKASSNSRGSSSAGNSPTTSLLLPSNGSGNAITPLKKEQRRNDTCEYCGKVFKNCSNLTVHRRSHTGEKPYKCSLCSYACAQSSKLTRHMKTHGRVGKDVYSCKFCNMPFSVPSTLEKHMRKCVENRQARILADGGADLSSEASNGDIQESFSQPHLST